MMVLFVISIITRFLQIDSYPGTSRKYDIGIILYSFEKFNIGIKDSLRKTLKKIPKKDVRNTDVLFRLNNRLLLLLLLCKALAAVNRTVRLGLERNLGLATASSADSSEVLPGTAGSSLAGVTAGLAALRLVLEATLCIELLLTGSEHELVAALFAN